jgi:hypothetical protein
LFPLSAAITDIYVLLILKAWRLSLGFILSLLANFVTAAIAAPLTKGAPESHAAAVETQNIRTPGAT